MTYEELLRFISEEMRMAHIYQPLLIKTLIEADGVASVRHIAKAFLSTDESQLLYYEKRIRQMPVPVLQRHGIVDRQGDVLLLKVPQLSFVQRVQAIQLCEEKIGAYLKRKGLGLFDHRLLEFDPVPEVVRLQVLKQANGRCQACGATSSDQPLQIDHIEPRSRGGSNDVRNLQVLCRRCNIAKSNKIVTDFRPQAPHHASDCPFCQESFRSRAFKSFREVFAVRDAFPVTVGHSLIVTDWHVQDFFCLTERGRRSVYSLAGLVRNELVSEDPTITGFNLGANCGEDAGQTIPHFHLHIIPRRKGDLDDPRGGVRGVIPEKRIY